MTYLGKETQITQAGQAVLLNVDAINQLAAAIRNGLGPNGATKMLITPAGEIRIVKDGMTLLKNIQLAQPGAVLLSKMVTQHGSECGDGVTSAIILTATMLTKALEYVLEGVHPQAIIGGLLEKEKEVLQALSGIKIDLQETAEHIRHLALTVLRAKYTERQARPLAEMLVAAVEKVKRNGVPDLKMLEIMKMPNIYASDPLKLVNGLVLDHGGRHPMMPKRMENVFILCTNISFEYEKPELNAQFYYSRAEDKIKMEEGERRILMQRVQQVLEMMQKVAQANSSLSPQFMLITQKGIDQHALEVFARYNVLALRRAKRRNMQRLQMLTGCTPISTIQELNENCFGFAGSVKEVSVGEEKYTFIEKTPHSTTCTLLIQGISPYQMEYTESSVRLALKAISCGIADNAVLPGGASSYYRLAETLSSPTTPQEEIATSIWKQGLLSVPKVLAKNMGHNSVDALSKMRLSSIPHPALDAKTGEIVDALEAQLLDNYTVTENTLRLAAMITTKILMIDEIIKSGKEVG